MESTSTPLSDFCLPPVVLPRLKLEPDEGFGGDSGDAREIDEFLAPQVLLPELVFEKDELPPDLALPPAGFLESRDVSA